MLHHGLGNEVVLGLSRRGIGGGEELEGAAGAVDIGVGFRGGSRRRDITGWNGEWGVKATVFALENWGV